ncbi:ABC transporter permease [Paenibacillus methanolicus]|uniref:ABC-2 type transport system permease protein n=1 Tax=Paenibacillus methanolicus TaxID=582686 RepID=A0A5S5BS48_9BACL|nr:ABC transporter permease [Paenibacillus methanolicus]TYP69817.1 ABC-2 type transport system permease protein [Paenibacillus methanolicus]
MERTSIETIWSKRSSAFWKSSMPYIIDMARSGVPFVTAMVLLTALASYTSLLRAMPPDFPFTLVGMAALTPVIAYSPLRTWLREADIVFLLPREGEMHRYIRRSFRYNGMPSLLAAFIVSLIYLPIYSRGPGETATLLLLTAVLAMKSLSIAAAWQERRLVWRNGRRWMRIARWLVTAVCTAAFVQTNPLVAIAIAAAGILLLALLYRSLPKYRIPWQTLIAEEKRTQRRYAVFFSAFADVPAETAQVARRGYLSWLGRRIRYSSENAFTYLYAHTLIRTELGGIAIRLTLLGMLSGWLAADAGLWNGWGAAGVYVLFIWLVGLQLSALTQSHRHSVWRHVYPLPESQRVSAVVRVDRFAFMIAAALLFVPHAIGLPAQGQTAQALVALAVGLAFILLVRPARIKRKMKTDWEEEDE